MVTGPDCFRMIKVDDNFAGATITHSSIDTSKNEFEVEALPGIGSTISTNYTCHCWSIDSCIPIICTDMGDILLLDFKGEFKNYLPESPRGYQLDCILPFGRGLIVAGDRGLIWTYEMN